MSREVSIDNVHYHIYPYLRKPKQHPSICPIGLDTEAYLTGECFMIATSEGDVFTPEQYPRCLFSRKYRGKTFVCYNLKYDESALLQHLPLEQLQELRSTDTTEYKGYVYKVIPRKCLVIRRNGHAVTMYDMLNFFETSLDTAAQTFLGERKQEIATVKFYPFYVQHFWKQIASYCVRDAVLVQRLSYILIKKLENYGVYPQKLYSIAYISYQYFRAKTPYVMVQKYWQHHREVLDFAMRSYNGGKFEVTEKGTGYFYEYDIISAYPFEIANLVDITWSRVVHSQKYRRQAKYAFLDCTLKIPFECNSPTVVRRGAVNTYPCGEYRRVITKGEYEYFISHGADVQIHEGWFLHIDNRQYPYKREIKKLVAMKQRFKQEGKDLDYHIIKILLNSLYGKMVQLINKGDYYEAGTSWNPIYGAIITSNVRVRVSEIQALYPAVIAVHTDSVISKTALPFAKTGELGEFILETEGQGILLGSGVYQIGDKTRFRGFNINTPLGTFTAARRKTVKITSSRPLTWREIAFHGWETDLINRFERADKKLSINFDTKRIWLHDWKNFSEVTKRNVESVPLIVDPVLF